MDTKNLAVVARPDPALSAQTLERVLVSGDLSALSASERLQYYGRICDSLGLNPLTRPLEYILLNDRLTLYFKRDGTDQLRASRKISTKIVSRELVDDIYIVTAQATTPDGRQDESIGAVPLVKEEGSWETGQSGKRFFKRNGKMTALAPEDRANAIMRAETKSKRRVTLSICGLGMLDESELDTLPTARPFAEPVAAEPPQSPVPGPKIGESLLSMAPIPNRPMPQPISEAERRRLFATLRDVGVSHEEFKVYLWACYGMTSTKDILTDKYNDLLKVITNGSVSQLFLALREAGVSQEEFSMFVAALYAPGSPQKPEERTTTLLTGLGDGTVRTWCDMQQSEMEMAAEREPAEEEVLP